MSKFHDEAIAAFRSGDNERTRVLSERVLQTARAAHEAPAEIDALCMLARVALREGDAGQVRALADQARDVARDSGEAKLERIPLHMQAVAARTLGDYELARRLYEESIELNKELGEERMVAAELHNLGYVELHDGRLARAKELFEEALVEARRTGYDGLMPYLVGDAAFIAAEHADPERAARLAGAAQTALRAAVQMPDPDDAAEQEELRIRLIGLLGDDRFNVLSQQGAELSVEDALAS